MKDYSELKEQQTQLDKEELYCPRCCRIANWFEIREYGVCGNCVYEDYKQTEGRNED